MNKELEQYIEKLYNKAKYDTMIAFREAKVRNEYRAIVERREQAAKVRPNDKRL